MGSYGQVLDTLERELQGVSDTFGNLSEDEWRMDTLLEPFELGRPRWTVFELAGHMDISIGLTRMLIASQEDGQPGRDQISFFIFPRSEVAPGVYEYAYTMVEGKTPADMPSVLGETFAKSISESRALPPETVGSGYYALMRLDEFVTSRVVEAVVHGIDLTDANRTRLHRHTRRHRGHRVDPRRAAGAAHRCGTAGRSRRRPGVDPCRLRPRRPRRPAPPAARLTRPNGRSLQGTRLVHPERLQPVRRLPDPPGHQRGRLPRARRQGAHQRRVAHRPGQPARARRPALPGLAAR